MRFKKEHNGLTIQVYGTVTYERVDTFLGETLSDFPDHKEVASYLIMNSPLLIRADSTNLVPNQTKLEAVCSNIGYTLTILDSYFIFKKND